MPEATEKATKFPAAEPEKSPRASVQERIDALEAGAKRRLDHLLESGNAGLSRIDHFLERVSKEDWTLTGMRRRFGELRSKAENAGTSALKRVDEMPGEAVSALATAGRARIQGLSRGLSAIAKRLETPPPGPPGAK
ncbi:MAG TPA: hypothetical protein VLS93_05680 [Anaeromyxobacteraceae bacterium]|nr:hypothetical protein [Anaeromyxobacteraceae bacterium]